MNFLIGTLYAEAILKLCEEARVKINQIDLVGSHGQTIFHQSEPDAFCGRTLASTLQIGEASIIAEQTGITTICDFRPRDMAAGGKGAPLIPLCGLFAFSTSTARSYPLKYWGYRQCDSSSSSHSRWQKSWLLILGPVTW